MSDKLILAVPSKGRLEESSAAFFAESGLPLSRDDARGYHGTMAQMDEVQIEYVSADEIAQKLAGGKIHLGITGEDLLRERIPNMETVVQLVMPLGFGHADVVVAVPNGWVDVTTMFDLADVAADFRARHARRLRVATKYTNLATDFLTRHNVTDIELVQSFGATEAAPATGAAEVIVDITSSGATLKANQLRVPEDGLILKSQANLTASLQADWNETARRTAKKLLAQLVAREKAKKYRQFFFTRRNSQSAKYAGVNILQALREKFPNVWREDDDLTSNETIWLVPEEDIQALIDFMFSCGYERAVVSEVNFIFESRNVLYEKLAGALP